MIVLAKGSITNPETLSPYVDDEMRVVGELKGEGVMKAVYRRGRGFRGVPASRGIEHRRGAQPNGQSALCYRGPHEP